MLPVFLLNMCGKESILGLNMVQKANMAPRSITDRKRLDSELSIVRF